MRSFIATFAVQGVLPSPLFLAMVLLLLVGLCYSKFLYKWMIKLRILVVLFAIWNIVWALPLSADILIKSLENKYQQPTQLPQASKSNSIVILSSGWVRTTTKGYETRLDVKGWERIYAGVKLWEKIGGTIYVAGGRINGTDNPISHVMEEVILKMGVPKSAIVLEDDSITTYENLNNISNMIDFSMGNHFIVTSALHMHRSMLVAQKLDLNLQPFPTEFIGIGQLGIRSVIPSLEVYERLHPAMHEWVGILFYKLKNRV